MTTASSPTVDGQRCVGCAVPTTRIAAIGAAATRPPPMFDTIDGANPAPNRHQHNSVARLPGPSGHSRRTILGRAARDSPCGRQAPHPARYPPAQSAHWSFSRAAWYRAAPCEPRPSRRATAACERDLSAVELHGQAMPCQPAILATAHPANFVPCTPGTPAEIRPVKVN
jgi:hypothetical protein